MTERETGSSPVRMGNVLNAEKQEQVRGLGRLGWSLRRIQLATGVRRETISCYLKEAGIEVRGPRQRRQPRSGGGVGPAKPASEVTADSGADSKPASQPFPDSGGERESRWSPRASSCEPHREFVEEGIGRGRPAKAIWQDLVDDRGFTASYECVKRFARKLGASLQLPHPRILTAPGEESQVDYGDGPLVRDPGTGKYRRTRLFALTLGCSRKSVWLLTWKSSSLIWCQLHEQAFRRLGGTTRTVVIDNLKEGVIKPDIYDPQLNPLYRDMLAHYGIVALPAKVRDPNRKGKVESSIGFADRRLAGMRFESMEEAQAYIDRWSERWADTRIHGTTKRQVAVMFAEERPALQPLPCQPFRYYEYGTRVVHLDGCVEVAAAYYSTPLGWMGKQVHVHWDSLFVRILHPTTGELLREHVRQKRGWHRIARQDESPKTPRPVEHLLSCAKTAGQHVGKLCEIIHRQRGQTAPRSILGVLSLVKKHGPIVVEQASQVAVDVGFPTYQFVRKYIDRAAPKGPQLRQVDALIRELTHYRDFIDAKTGTSP